MIRSQRRAITVSGIVQGVGFRPFVHALASRLQLAGFVRNQAGEVQIEVEGPPTAIDQFVDQLQSHPPRLACVIQVNCRAISPRGQTIFSIVDSASETATTVLVSPDVGTCEDCRRELFDRFDRRFGYPFLNCTNCGPRLTIIKQAPYDRANTTMAKFELCPRCLAEYTDPRDRRFHAQPTACPDCGPRLRLLNQRAEPIESDDPLRAFASALNNGKIGAVKGLGGYHLACLADDDVAVGQLRQRKHRDEKPFAVMVQDERAARALCVLDDSEMQLLKSFRRPIVLLRKRGGKVCELVAPGNPYLGVMLPYTPLHELLMEAAEGQPLVMTSGNRSDEPIAYQDDDAIERLRGIADLFLIHDRPIHVRCDDSVTRMIAGKEALVRRSRGYAPQPIRLPFRCPVPILAVGAQLKGVFAFGRDQTAIPSHHLGDLDHLEAFVSFRRDIALYEQLFDVRPQCIAHDLHPDYASSHYAVERANRDSIPMVAVQHHHAHLASCMAEHGLQGEVIGVVFDGSGYGIDGTIWGGEFLTGDYTQFVRAGHLRPVRLPGGDKATKEPWRTGLSHLMDAGCKVADSLATSSRQETRVVEQMVSSGLNAPWASSMGRLFDAVAAIIGIRQRVSFEGQAAVELEALAHDARCDVTYPFELAARDSGFEVDTRPLIRAVVADYQKQIATHMICRRFQNTIAEMVLSGCRQIRARSGLERVVLSGGVFMNNLLTTDAISLLELDGFAVFRQHAVPANDGGISLGQIAIAAHRLEPTSPSHR